MSQRAELHLAGGLDALQESSVSLQGFTESLREQLMTVDEDMDPKRLVILGARPKNLESEGNASIPSQTVHKGAKIDFEVYPGPPGKPSPGQFLKKFATQMRDKKVSKIEGKKQKAVWKALTGASLVVTQGSKVHDAAAKADIQDEEQDAEWLHMPLFLAEWYDWLLSDTQKGSSPSVAMLLPVAFCVGAEWFP